MSITMECTSAGFNAGIQGPHTWVELKEPPSCLCSLRLACPALPCRICRSTISRDILQQRVSPHTRNGLRQAPGTGVELLPVYKCMPKTPQVNPAIQTGMRALYSRSCHGFNLPVNSGSSTAVADILK